MARDFKIELDNVEMINGSDDLLKDTKVTKVTITGENKLNSLNSTFENCTELTSIEGEINLDGISDMTEMALNTTLDELKIINPTEENIQADNSLNQVTNVKIGGTKYAKGGIQDVVGSLDWNAENFVYEDTILDNIYSDSSYSEDSKNLTISNTLEQKATSIEITGQTYENLVDGKATKNLLDEMSMQQTEGKPTQFTPHMEQPICLEYIEGQTYQNLIKGKGEYKLTDTFSTTWTESNNNIENPPSMIEIPEIWGNTVQGFANCVTTDQIVTSLVNTINTGATSYNKRYMPNNSGGYVNVSDAGLGIEDFSLLTDECFIQLKPNTTYSYRSMRVGSSQQPNTHAYSPSKSLSTIVSGKTFTTDSTGKVILYPQGCQDSQVGMKLVEGEYDLTQYPWDYDLNVIQSVGDLYVDESGEPILDEEGNEQYKLEIESSGKNLFCDKILKVVNKVEYNGKTCYIGRGSTYDNSSFQISNIFKANTQYTISFNVENPNNATWAIMNIQYSDFQYATTINFANTNKIVLTSREGYSISHIHATAESGKDLYLYNIQLEENSATEYEPYQSNKTTILMPQPLRKVANGRDKLYWDLVNKKYYIEKNIFSMILDGSQNYIFHWRKDGYVSVRFYASNPTKVFGNTIIANRLPVGSNCYDSPKEVIYTAWDSNIYICLKSDYDFNNAWLVENPITVYYYGDTPQIIETKILEKPSLDAYSPKTYITTNTEIQPSQMSITNKKVDYIPLGLQPNTDYTLQLDSVGKDDKPITVNLGGTETTIQPTNDTSKHHKVVVGTPATLTTDKLELSGEGVVVNDVMLFEGGSNDIKQEVEYVEGIQNIGELQEDGTYKIDILTNDGNKIFDADTWVNSTLDGAMSNSGFYKVLGSNMIEIIANDGRTSSQVKQIQLKPNTKYSILCNDASLIIYIFFKLQATGQISGRSKIDFTTDETGRIGFKIPDGVGKIVKIDIVDEKGFNYSAWSTQSILLPQPLNKIGDIKDKFYWDDDKGHYCIEQNIDKNLEVLETPKIIDLPHLNKKYSLDTYMPTTYVDVTNLPLQPYGLLLEDDTVRYKSTIEPSTLYTIQFNCLSKLTTRLTLDLGGTRKTVDPIIGVNHVQITTPSELASDRLFLIGTGIVVKEVIVNKGTMNQYPKYFDGEHSVGELQTDGSYKIVIKTNEGFTVTIRTSSPLTKLDKIYWNDTEKRYEIDRNGAIEVPTVEGDIVDLPRLYQREDTTISISTDNIEPSKIEIEYKDINNN